MGSVEEDINVKSNITIYYIIPHYGDFIKW